MGLWASLLGAFDLGGFVSSLFGASLFGTIFSAILRFFGIG